MLRGPRFARWWWACNDRPGEKVTRFTVRRLGGILFMAVFEQLFTAGRLLGACHPPRVPVPYGEEAWAVTHGHGLHAVLSR